MTDRDKIKVAALLAQQYEVECLLAEALGYVYEADHGWVIGDHTVVTLAREVRRWVDLARQIMANHPSLAGMRVVQSAWQPPLSPEVLLTREEVAHRYHRYHCHNSEPHACDALDQDDYDYADALAEILAVGGGHP